MASAPMTESAAREEVTAATVAYFAEGGGFKRLCAAVKALKG